MAGYQNPAGRLHELLRRFGSNPKISMSAAWADALQVEESEVPYYLGQVASLLLDVRRAAENTGSPAFDPMPTHLNTLARSIFPADHAFGAEVAHVRPDGNAMQMLAALDYALSLSASEGMVPDAGTLDELKESVTELVDDVARSNLPPEMKRALHHRLAEMLEALEHLELGGPEAVRRAAESLAATSVIYAGGKDDDGITKKVAAVARKTWTAFTVITALASSVLTWDKIVDLTGSLGQGEEQRQLPPGPRPPVDERPPPPLRP